MFKFLLLQVLEEGTIGSAYLGSYPGASCGDLVR